MATKRKAGRKKKSQGTSGWVWLITGLAIGLAIAAGIYVQDRGGTAAVVIKAKEAAQALPDTVVSDTPVATRKEPVFTFYRDLPGQSSQVPDEEFSSKPKPPPKTIVDPGSYILQVASFSTNKDAERLKANLALNGITADIQKVKVDGKAYHRVLIGPLTDLSTVNRTRSQLMSLNIQPMTIQVGD
jgi:cell division protein FtsN